MLILFGYIINLKCLYFLILCFKILLFIKNETIITIYNYLIFVFRNTNDFKQVQKLVSHNLTVTQLSFSPDSKKLLSVSRDRTWSLFEYDLVSNSFVVISKSDKRSGIHTRIIWCCAWSHDSVYFVTGSRDGKLVIWGQTIDSKISYCAKTEPLVEPEKSFTAVAFAPKLIDGCNSYLLAVGSDCGHIAILKWNHEEKSVTPWFKLADLCNEYPFLFVIIMQCCTFPGVIT